MVFKQGKSLKPKTHQKHVLGHNIISGIDSREKALVYYNQANEIMERT